MAVVAATTPTRLKTPVVIARVAKITNISIPVPIEIDVVRLACIRMPHWKVNKTVRAGRNAIIRVGNRENRVNSIDKPEIR